MNNFETDTIEKIIAEYNDSKNIEKLCGVIFSLGRDAENDEEYDYALKKLVQLSEIDNPAVLSNIILAFSMLALYHKRLDRTITEPIIKKAVKLAESPDDKVRISDAVSDIKRFLGWKSII